MLIKILANIIPQTVSLYIYIYIYIYIYVVESIKKKGGKVGEEDHIYPTTLVNEPRPTLMYWWSVTALAGVWLDIKSHRIQLERKIRGTE